MNRFIATLIFFCLIGCAGTLQRIRYTSEDLQKVRIFTTAPNGNYPILGTIAETDEYYDDLIEDLQKRALEMGGNALIIVQQGKKGNGGEIVGTSSLVVGSGGDEEFYILANVIKIQ